MSKTGIWFDPSNNGPAWGVMLHESDDGALFGGYYGFSNTGNKVWFELVDRDVLNTDNEGNAAAGIGRFAVRLNDDGTIHFEMSVPRKWTHPVDFSPAPTSTVIVGTLTRLV